MYDSFTSFGASRCSLAPSGKIRLAGFINLRYYQDKASEKGGRGWVWRYTFADGALCNGLVGNDRAMVLYARI